MTLARWAFSFCLFSAAFTPVLAAERGYSVTDFDRIEVSGPFVVTVETGRGPSARASGTQESFDRISIEMMGRMLKIKPSISKWGERSSSNSALPVIKVTVPMLRDAFLNGSGSLKISKMRGQTLRLSLAGSGQLGVDAIETDRLAASTYGTGTIILAGKAAIGRLNLDGAGSINAIQLRVDNLDLSSSSAGTATVTAGKTAKIVSTGTGNIDVSGSPACTVNAVGAGQVSCGPKSKTSPPIRP